MIPEAAVEAAVDALVASKLGDHQGIGGEEFVEAARAALEAAGPHLVEVQWGVRDCVSWTISGHGSEESARATAAAHPEWYEVVSRPMPGLWTATP